MTLLRWRRVEDSDREGLKSFCCTVDAVVTMPGYRRVHPAEWEQEAQDLVRNLRPPIRHPQHCIVGIDDDGIGAVSVFEFLGSYDVVEVLVLAVARRHRGKDGAVADEALRMTVAEIESLAIPQGVTSALVTAYVFAENFPSQELCQRNGLNITAQSAFTNVQKWQVEVPVGEPDDQEQAAALETMRSSPEEG